MKRYVAGLLFDETLETVLLIKKNRPEWQAGKLNAVGGKLEEDDESYLSAMHREFKEETGLDVVDWKSVCMLGSGIHLWDSAFNYEKDDWQVQFYAASVPRSRILQAEDVTDEDLYIGIVSDMKLYKDVVTNLKWLIPMAMETLQFGNSYDVAER